MCKLCTISRLTNCRLCCTIVPIESHHVTRKIPDNPTLRPKEAIVATDMRTIDDHDKAGKTGVHSPIRRRNFRASGLIYSFLFIVVTAAAVGIVAMQKGYEAGQANPSGIVVPVAPTDLGGSTSGSYTSPSIAPPTVGFALKSTIGMSQTWEIVGALIENRAACYRQATEANRLSCFQKVWYTPIDASSDAGEGFFPNSRATIDLSSEGVPTDTQVAYDGQTVIANIKSNLSSFRKSITIVGDKTSGWKLATVAAA